MHIGTRWFKWLERQFTDRKVHGSNPTSALDFPFLSLGNLAVSQPSCFLLVAWQLGTEKVLRRKQYVSEILRVTATTLTVLYPLSTMPVHNRHFCRKLDVSLRAMFEISRYMHRHNNLLTRLLKNLRQPTTGFAPSWGFCAHSPSGLVQHIQLLKNITNEGFSWVPGESLANPNLFATECILLISCNLGSRRT
ncbi:hypothetical protein CSKR_101581 [Clonorchis sinensis]|uniref:Uncharacterized protein n=1 Tax=Clonorchis sinensis TaxID=79923 RepID=A0A419PSE4_CLOSI|nr:hypothetical protein CSKR_101581 [Clonorchis sinensis]